MEPSGSFRKNLCRCHIHGQCRARAALLHIPQESIASNTTYITFDALRELGLDVATSAPLEAEIGLPGIPRQLLIVLVLVATLRKLGRYENLL